MTTFAQAFAAARKKHGGGGGTFTWKGKQYTTDRADDPKPMKESPRPKARPDKAGEAPTKKRAEAEPASKEVIAAKKTEAHHRNYAASIERVKKENVEKIVKRNATRNAAKSGASRSVAGKGDPEVQRKALRDAERKKKQEASRTQTPRKK
jgi:hypothetical protein